MLDALEMPKPKLVINLLISQGFRSFTNDQGDRLFDQQAAEAGVRGCHFEPSRRLGPWDGSSRARP